ncbi:TlpA disulfide reductase family protein [Sphingobacterium sp. MYb382]|uniref:TlpA disulfide reductase family protein n=1 Tax=Sphingobacterium sp. MYb382 TaxID=2745278 RepID=UPI0030A415D5
MKNKLIGFAALMLLFVVQASAQKVAPLRLKGTVTGAKDGIIYLQQYDNKIFKTVDSTLVKNGRFSFATKVQLPELYGLKLTGDGYPVQVFLEDAPIEVAIQWGEKGGRAEVKGSKAQAYFESSSKEQRKQTAKEFIETDPKSIVAAYTLFRNYSYNLSPDELEAHIKLLDPSLQQTQYVSILKDLIQKQRAVLPGKKALDFVSKDPNGNTVRFSDHLGKGYVLLDFWAAWCGPCRRENPNVVAAFQKYKNKGFTVFGVSLDKDKASWVKAIKDDGLDWAQVSDLAFWDTEAAALYGVRFIPSNLLIDEHGVIVARNIKGEELQEKLKEIYGE